MTKNFLRIALLTILLFQIETICQAQLSPIDFEQGGYGATWTWTTFENDSNPAVQIISNPFPGGINTSDHVAEFTALQAGQPWAGFESLHGAGIGTFTLDTTNSIIKVMVYKSVISDVGVKLVTPPGGSTGELKVPNTLINQWEELTFDFTSQIGHPQMIGLDQIVIFPDFDLNGRASDNICYIDNIQTGAPSVPVNVKFEVQNTDSTPVYLFGSWNNWSNFPGAPMSMNANGNYEITVSLPPNTSIEYQYVNSATAEVLNPADACTNGNAQYTNRLTVLGTVDTSFCNQWESCATCVPLSVSNLNKEDIQILAGESFVRINADTYSEFDELEIFNLVGKRMYKSTGRILANKNISVNLNKNKFYFLRIKKGSSYFTSKALIVE